jgi:hypothetical protein
MAKADLSDEQELAIQQMIREGRSLCEVCGAFPEARCHDLREVYSTFRRAIRTGRMRDFPADFEDRKAWVQSQWSPEDWSRRWVGRYAQVKETDLQQAASKMLW